MIERWQVHDGRPVVITFDVPLEERLVFVGEAAVIPVVSYVIERLVRIMMVEEISNHGAHCLFLLP